MPLAVRNNKLEDVQDDAVDYVIDNPTRLLGSHTNMIPLPSAVQGTRLFYGARFFNQAVPIVDGEAPLVQNLDPEDNLTFDEKAGKNLGAVYSRKGGVVKKVTPDSIILDTPDGPDEVPLYRNFILNRKSQINNTPLVEKGQIVEPGQLLARSNFTDDKGRMAMGLNARIALAPYKGYSMDDAIVMREGFAKRLNSEAAYAHRLDFKNGVKGGKNHFTALFHDKFSRDQLKKLDDDGVVEVGQKVEPGDPLVLATKKRVISSQNLDLGGLSRYMQKSRADASEVWEHESPGTVVNVARTRNGVKVDVVSNNPTKVGDKVVLRQGGKAILSHVIPDDQMPRTEDGRPLDVLLNQLSLPSRVNAASLYEILLGKVARARGEPIKVPPFLQKGEKMHDYVQGLLDEHGLSDKERVYDPSEDRWLDNPITVGDGYIMKLHHEVESKRSERGQAGYDAWNSPAKGGFEGGKAKRLSGLETTGLLSAGAYNVLRESATLRGTRNDEFWRQVRMGQDPKEPGVPFAWKRYLSMLSGAGLEARPIEGEKGGLRLGFYTDKDLDKNRPVEVNNGDVIDISTLAPVKGGLFDDKLTTGNKWGYIPLDEALPNPAAEKVIRKLLGVTEQQYRDILEGKEELKT